MKVFFSWSGDRSKHIAIEFSNWLEQVLQAVEPWVSADIEKGRRWDGEIAKKLEASKVSVICLTKDNLDSTWIHFEAGAISKTEDAYVCTFLFDITPANVKEPLSLFQATQYNKEDMLKLLKTINGLIGANGEKSLKDSNLESVFETFWPHLEEKLKATPAAKGAKKDVREDREILEECLQILRSLKEGTNIEHTIPLTPPPSGRPVAEIISDSYWDYIKANPVSIGKLLEDSKQFEDFKNYLVTKRRNHYPDPLIKAFLRRMLRDSPES
jgi:hypothetical protein